MTDPARSDDLLNDMLGKWAAADPDERVRIGEEIQRIFEEPLAILVLDMSGFSSTVVRHGITRFLAKIREMRSVAVPAIERRGGTVVKFIADDVLATFASPDDALAAAREIIAETKRDFDRLPDMQFEVSIGIGYGPTICVPATDLWGNEANQAFKLGEDTATAGEIILTEAAYEALEGDREGFERLELVVSGLSLVGYSTKMA